MNLLIFNKKFDILVNFRVVAIHPTLWRVTPLYGSAVTILF